MCINKLHALALTQQTVARFVGTGGFLTVYSSIHTK